MSDDRPPIVSRQLLLVMVAAPIIVGLAILVFTWPAARSRPRDVPVGVVASGAAGDALAGKVAAAHGMFDVHRYPSAAAARTAIRHRDAYAAIISTGSRPQLLLASADGPSLSTALQPALTKLVGSSPPTVVDVVPTPKTDPQGSVLGGAVLPLTLAGEISAILLAFSTRPGLRQVLPLMVISAAIGLIGTAIVQAWLAVLDGGTWWIGAGVLALTVLAIGAIVLGLHALLGRFGLPIAVAMLVFVGNAFSGATSSPELLPEGIKRVGQWLPPGSGNELLRSASFFHGYGWVHPFTVLVVWIALGFIAVSVGAVLAERRSAGTGRHEAEDDASPLAPVSG